MINNIYQLVKPKVFNIKHVGIHIDKNIIIKPRYMSICHADQRYYNGQRDVKILEKKLPMALIHECCGEIAYDYSGKFKIGQKVALIPNFNLDKNYNFFENYGKNAGFLSSGYDGFMREFVNLNSDRIINFEDIDLKIASITEFVSVAVHSVNRFLKISHYIKNRIGVLGDGSLAYILCLILKKMLKKSKIIVIGKNQNKLNLFDFVDESYISNNISENLEFDHAFECVGGEGSSSAIQDIIKHINPLGSIVLLGVTENKVYIDTRNILEKGLTLVGSSRSGKVDFEKALFLMKNLNFQKKLEKIIYEDEPVESIEDIHRVFNTDLKTSFKTVFEWKI
ncbi:MAG: ribulose-5-phosphate reductase [Candidatus Paraimprobicoccus trichonymphae]|uniref:Ribulose-5-phosphate reductase n=1 Tax=Candidatus Paraimprobicoccus trichonymphae TaxID=3033793 RepID=A0AA48IA41_9FIRM|nr:MAG: ribulose-5-phosphate reductase [Candidatus Paraimprobicoccus trichonymphae]